MTIDPQRTIVACEATMEATPFSICPAVAPNFGRLAGLRIEGGFLKRAMERVGGAQGCTHLRELLQQVGTVFVQTLYSVGKLTDEPAASVNAPQRNTNPPPLLNSCFAWADDGPVVAEKFPAWSRQARILDEAG